MKAESSVMQHSSRNQWRNRLKDKNPSKETAPAQTQPEKTEKPAEPAAKPEISEGTSILKKIASVPTPSLPSVPSKPLSISAAKKVKEDREGVPSVIKKPAVFFISGWRMGGLKGPSFLEEMSKYIPDGKHFNWDDKDQMLSEIKKRPIEQPVVLVGYGLGGGTALSMANQLNNIKNGFRGIDLLVTIDASGTSNDIIPQNVKKHMNFIGDSGGLFHDGPHIARNTEMTEVVNELRSEKDISLEENTELQYKVFEGISDILSESVIKKDLLRVLSSSEFGPCEVIIS